MSIAKSLGFLNLGLLFVAACGGSAPVPATAVTESKSAIRAAEEVGAQNVPKAALHLKMARDQVATAEALISDGENEEAALVLDRAEVDAELAIALAREAGLRAQAAEARAKVQKLRADASE